MGDRMSVAVSLLIYIVALLYLFRNVNFGAVRLSVSDPFWGLFRDVKHGRVFRIYGVIVKYYTAKV